MSKVIVEVFVPVAEMTCDLWIPTHLMMYEALALICRAATELSGGLFTADDSTVICNRYDGTILNINKSVEGLGLENGSKLMLI